MTVQYPIQKGGYNDGGFDFAGNLGNFIGNKEFSEGFEQFSLGQETSKSFLWQALSAIGQDIGSTVYQNIRNYVELASDVETCKVVALQSMFDNIGFDISLVGELGSVPVEILDIVDMYSVNSKYLKDMGFLGSDAFMQVQLNATETDTTMEISDVGVSSDGAYLNRTTLNDQKFQEYLVDIFQDTISSFLTLPYNIVIDGGINPFVYMSIVKDVDGQYQKEVEEYRSKNNIEPTFDLVSVVDSIENGTDSKDKYPENVQGLIQMEMVRRSEMIGPDFIKRVYDADGKGSFQSRYSFYRRKKVQEYAGFVERKYKSTTNKEEYQLDHRYTVYGMQNGKGGVFKIDPKGNPSEDIDMDMVGQVARRLARTTVYIRELRERLKLQARKCYMKGTNNLILYLVNEYLVDYSRNAIATEDGLSSKEYVKNAMQQLSSHSLSDVNVIEYYDTTEYYNIDTESTVSAARADSPTNSRYWEQDQAMENDGIQLRLDQIDRFYLSTMMMKEGLTKHSDVTDFLDTIYDFSARKDFMDQEGNFHTKLGNGEYTNSIYPILTRLMECRDEISSRLSSGYQRSEQDSQLSTQKSEIAGFIENALSNQYLSSVSSDYEENSSKVQQLQERLDQLCADFSDFLSGQYQMYFNSYEGSEYDYFNGNPNYRSDNIAERINLLQHYVQNDGNIVNHYATDAANDVRNGQADISSRLQISVVNQIYQYGYDPTLVFDSLDKRFDDVDGFLDENIENRKQYIKEIVDGLKSQVKELDNQYNQLNNSFTIAVSQYDTKSPQYPLGSTTYMKFSDIQPTDGKEYLTYNLKEDLTSTAKPQKDYIIVPGVQWVFYTKNSGRYYGWQEQTPQEAIYESTDNLKNRCKQLESWMDLEVFDGFKGLKNDGTMAAVAATLNGLVEVDDKMMGILKQVKDVFGYNFAQEYDKVYNTNEMFISNYDVEDRLIKLQDFVNSKLDETFIQKDVKLNSYESMKKISGSLRNQFEPYKKSFQDVFQNQSQQEYMQDFQGNHDTSDITLSLVGDLIQFIAETDQKNRTPVKNGVEKFVQTLTELQSDATKIIDELSKKYNMTAQDPYIIQAYIDGIQSDLIGTVQVNEYNGNLSVFNIMTEEVIPALDFLSENIGTTLDGREDFMQQVQYRIEQLNYMDRSDYQTAMSVMLNYGGMDFAYYPYMNWKNQTHPSYQIHQFMWNLVEKDELNLQELSRKFFSANVANLEWNRIVQKADEYYGKYGQVINKWTHPELLDYTGYTSRYEASYHSSTDSRLTSEVIDYDGPFYPPAIDFLMSSDVDMCVKSIVSAMTPNKVYETVIYDQEMVNSEIYDYMRFDEVSKDGVVQMVYHDSDRIVQRISSTIVDTMPIDVGELSQMVLGYVEGTTYPNHSWYGFARHLSSSVPNTFFNRFYGHLGLDKSSRYSERKLIGDQIMEYWDQISSITNSKSISEQEDIYFYGMDAAENMYTVYKSYGKEDPNYHEKRDAAGTLWIRKKNHPLSFPAFAGDNPQVETSSMSQQLKDEIESFPDGQFVYDMRFTDDGTQCAIVSKIPGDGYSEEVQFYENSIIAIAPVNTERTECGKISFEFNGATNYDDRITTGSDGYDTESELSTLDGEHDIFAYLGSFNTRTDDISHVFAKKRYNDGVPTVLGDIKVVKTQDCMVIGELYSSLGTRRDDIFGDQICFAKHSDNHGKVHLDFAYMAEDGLGVVSAMRNGNHTNLMLNTEGPTIDDISEEMNSHDIHEQDVVVDGFELDDWSISLVNHGIHNINADMSYIPSYPDVSGQISVNYGSNVACIELLGPSQDLTKLSNLVNTSVNPYFYSDLLSSEIYGMVWEDYRQSDDKSITDIGSPAINERNCDYVNVQFEGMERGCFLWEIDIQERQFTDRQLSNMNMVFLKKSTLGKNPYAIARLRDMDGLGMLPVLYNDQTDKRNVVTGYENFDVIGRFQYGSDINPNSNRIDEVEDVFLMYEEGNPISVFFEVKEERKQFFQIKEDLLQVILFNPNDLQIFEKYHFLDTYGMVNIVRGTMINPFLPQRLHDIGFDQNGGHWGIFYDRNKKDPSEVEKEVKRFFYDVNNRIVDIEDIHLSDYSYLSDVYCLQEEDRLAFKYADQDYFTVVESQDYYFPTLNWKYPKTIAMTLWDQLQKQIGGDLLHGYNMVGEIYDKSRIDRTFIIQMDDPEYIADMVGNVAIRLQKDQDLGVVVSENFISSYENPKRYQVQDPRIMDFCVFGEYPPEDKDSINGIIDNSQTTEQAILGISSFGTTILAEENGRGGRYGVETVGIDGKNADIGDFMKIYANYAKNGRGIRLMFNYMNYLDTPFIKIKDGRQYPDIIDGSYLVLDQGQSGVLNLVAQVRYVNGGILMGVRTITLARYEIRNISDDKPKFTVRRTGTIKRNSYSSVTGDAKVRIVADNSEIRENQEKVVSHVCVYTSPDIQPGYTVQIRFNRNSAKVEATRTYGGGYEVDLQAYMDGFIKFRITRPGDIHIPITITPNEGFKPGSQLLVEVSYSGITDANGDSVEAEVRNGIVRMPNQVSFTRVWWSEEEGDYKDIQITGECTGSEFSIDGHTKSDAVKIELGNSVTSIGEHAFSTCASLVTVTIPNSVTDIGDDSFYGCTSIKVVEIPDSVASIGEDSFNGCTSLEKVTIPNSVISIGDNAFQNCRNLESLVFTGIGSAQEVLDKFENHGTWGISDDKIEVRH